MKAQAEAKTLPVAGMWAKAADYVELTKPRISAMVLVATIAGFYMGSGANLNLVLLLHTLIGTGLVGAGANAINMAIEREPDSKMLRTRNRPLPAGRMSVAEVVTFSVVTTVAGVAYLCFAASPLAGLLAAATFLLYAFVYTPLKRITTFNTLVGAAPGALPPMIGWAAATGGLTLASWSLFAILFLWQIPHFMAIAWLYREDYARGGYMMLPVVDHDGDATARQIITQTLALIAFTLLPTMLGLTGRVYFFSALVLGFGFLWFGALAARRRTNADAKRLLLASIVYLPLLFIIMMMDKL